MDNPSQTSILDDDDDDDVIAFWLQGRSPHTIRSYQRVIADFQQFVQTTLPNLTVTLLYRYIEKLSRCSLKPSSINHRLAVIKSLLRFAQRIGYLSEDVSLTVRPLKVPSGLSKRILTAGQVQGMIQATTKSRDRLILKLLYGTGIRVSELTLLKWTDVLDLGNQRHVLLVSGKGSKDRSIRLPNQLAAELTVHRCASQKVGPLFRGYRAKPISQNQIREIVKQAGLRVGISGVSPHWLRHSHVSHALDKGAPAHLVQTTVGHASLATTTRYAHALPDASSSQYLTL